MSYAYIIARRDFVETAEDGVACFLRKEHLHQMTITITAARPDSAEAQELITELDTYLHGLYPSESCHGYSIEKLLAEGVAFFLIRRDDMPAGCGGIKLFDSEYGEIKRMYVRPEYQGMGLGRIMLQHLEDYARSRNIDLLRLETGVHQEAAMRLYERMAYQQIPRFGDYPDDPLSVFYEKRLV